MLTQQLGRYLFKTFREILAEKSPDTKTSSKVSENPTRDYILAYISNPNVKASAQFAGDLADPSFFVTAFGHRAAYLTATALKKRDVERRTWNSILIDIYRCSCVSFSPLDCGFNQFVAQSLTLRFPPHSVAHSQFVLVNNFANAIQHDEELKAQPALHRIMTTCFELFGTHRSLSQFILPFLIVLSSFQPPTPWTRRPPSSSHLATLHPSRPSSFATRCTLSSELFVLRPSAWSTHGASRTTR